MALNFGGILGAAGKISGALSKPRSVKQFLRNIDKYGIQVANNFEVNFSGLADLIFFIQDITIPGMHQNFTQVYYDGKAVDIPVNYEYDHDFSMTVINDAQGYIYSAVTNFILSDVTNQLASSGYTMVVKALTGDKHYKGTTYTLSGVRFVNVSSLSYGQSNNSMSVFTISFKCIDCVATPGAAGKVSGFIGAASSLGL